MQVSSVLASTARWRRLTAAAKRAGVRLRALAGTISIGALLAQPCGALHHPVRCPLWTVPHRPESFHVLEDGSEVCLQESLSSARGLTRLLSFRFPEGRPRLSPEEEAGIRAQATAVDTSAALRNPATAILAIGYINRDADRHGSRRIAFRRAQIIADLLRDTCGVTASIQVLIHRVKDLPPEEQQGKERLVEIWMVNP